MAEKKETKGKKAHKNNAPSKRWEKYHVQGNSVKKDRECPRCGAGIFLAKSNNRLYCGKCHYTEFLGK